MVDDPAVITDGDFEAGAERHDAAAGDQLLHPAGIAGGVRRKEIRKILALVSGGNEGAVGVGQADRGHRRTPVGCWAAMVQMPDPRQRKFI
jgi:hypothetical protein